MVEHSRNVYKGIKGYMNRRSYKKLIHGSSRSSRVEVLGGSDSCKKRRLSWRLKLNKKLKLKFKFSISPKKILMSLRDGYVNFMNKIGNTSLVIGGGFSNGGYGYGSNVVHGFGTRTLKEYDEKMIAEIYKSLVIAQAQLVPCDVAKLGRRVICSREY
ncbi:hypothetical protein Leryth_004738 [Lithospermum erythrorhizon]|uniref:Ribosomal protein L20 n=1 Tax=Lithospermum erythrorhizon TaxID=34254 RepID=A0AAV3P0D4_LITER|nr:hypothetical protein Leryth_004738 [Lithospermum erythrorhizon]